MRLTPYTQRGLRRCQCVRCKMHRADRQILLQGRYYAICGNCGQQHDMLTLGFLRVDPRVKLEGSVSIQEEINLETERGKLSTFEPVLYR